jgi:hypothetical protein
MSTMIFFLYFQNLVASSLLPKLKNKKNKVSGQNKNFKKKRDQKLII